MLVATLRPSLKALLALCALPFGACAASSAESQQQLDSLRAQVGELRAKQAEQDREIASLKVQLSESRPASSGDVARPQATATTARAEAATTTASAPSSAPKIPENLKVVYVAPDPVELHDEPSMPHAREAAVVEASRAPRHIARPHADPAPIPTETELREPVNPDDPATGGLSAAGIDVAYKAALAAPDGSALESFARLHPEASQSDNALFEAGVRAERAGQAERAAKDFSRAVKEHPAGDVVADALLHLAACQLQLHDRAAAKQTLSRITTQFPGSAQAEAAQTRLGDLGD